MEYEPVSCSLYDRIESLAVYKKNVEVIYSDHLESKTICGKIENIYSCIFQVWGTYQAIGIVVKKSNLGFKMIKYCL